MAELSAITEHPDEAWLQNPLIATKFYIPPLPPRFVVRPRLLQQLNSREQEKLTFICAPAGFGKSSLLSEWRAGQMHHTVKQTPTIAWVSLDSSDNDPVRFWSYILTALARVQPGIAEDAFVLLQSPQSIAIELIITSLINDFLNIPGQIVLILDDYHIITNPAIHQELTFLLDNFPPQLHIIMATRSEPPLALSLLRSRGQLIELRADDLRFTLEETVTFLKTATGLAFAEETVALLEQRTEGWIAGLHMATLSLKGRTDSANFIAAFAGSHRYILDYLSEEVISQQVEAVQHFLLQTSILDRLSGPLCDAVTEQKQSQKILAYLEQANLFIVLLDDERNWYRYHHLLADVLRRQLQQSQPELIPVLHHRAAIWYEQQGFIAEAVGHALAARDYEWAALMMEKAATPMLLRGERTMLHQWVQSLPQTLLQSHPRLCIDLAWLFASSRVQLEAVEPYLRLAEAYLVEKPEDQMVVQAEEMLGEIDGIRAMLIRHQGDFPRAVPLFEHALKHIPRTMAFQRALICMNLGASLVYIGKVEPAQPILSEAVELSQEAGSLYSLMQAFYRLSWVQVIQGQLHRAYATCQRGFQLINAVTEQEDSVYAWIVYVGMGNILREWNRLDEAAEVLMKGIEGCEHNGEIFLQAIGYSYLAHVRLAQGVPDEAQALLHTAEQLLQHHRMTIPFSTTVIPYYQLLIWLAQGKLDMAIQWVRKRQMQVDRSLGFIYGDECLTIAKVLLAQARGGKAVSGERPLEEALLMMKQTYLDAKAEGRRSQVIDVLNVQALLLQEQGNTSGALDALKQALILAEPEGYIRLFVDEGPAMSALLQCVHVQGIAPTYINTLLAAFDIQQPDQESIKKPSRFPLSSLLEPLSERELEVLELIAEGKSNEEIGRTLYVSMGTVKTHLKHIYGKLDVHTRTQAVARAREVRLLSS